MFLVHKLTDKLAESKRFIKFVAVHFAEDGCTYRASALTLATLLAIVPLMSLSLAILSNFPAFQNLSSVIQNFVFTNFVPTTGKIIQDYLQLFAAQAAKLSIVGVIFLFIVALLVLYTVEDSLNKIWRVRKARHGVFAFLSYWAVVSLSPFLLGLSIAASSYFLSLPLLQNYQVPLLLNYAPFVLSLAGFTCLYIIVPNRPVKIRHGLLGGITAAFLFEIAKQAFAMYLSYYNIYKYLYGAFATVPIFLIWVYWVWVITLLGAEITYALSVHHQRRIGTPLDGFSQALLWLYKLQIAQNEGRALAIDALINASTQAYAIDIDEMIAELSRLALIKETIDGRFVLCRNLSQLTLYDLTQMLPYRLPRTLENDEVVITKTYHDLVQKTDTALDSILKISIDKLFV